jgi:putative nucleotidyltransferase with HDIG domain
MKFSLTKTQSLIITLVKELNGKIFVVGGALRDIYLDKEPKDLDFVINVDLDLLKQRLNENQIYILPDEVAYLHGIIRALDNETGEIIDIAHFRKDTSCDGRYATIELAATIDEDLQRRDLTINGIAGEIDENGQVQEVIDPFDGRQAIISKQISFIGNAESRIKEDALRMVRACRFTTLGKDWTLDEKAKTAIELFKLEIFSISPERIRMEFIKALQSNWPSNFIRALRDTELLALLCPIMDKSFELEGGQHHAEAVGEHLLLTLDAAIKRDDRYLFRLAALFHDIGKLNTYRKDENGKITFYNHETVGADIAKEWMVSLKFSTKEINYVCTIIKNHMWHFDINSKDKTICKFLNKIGKDIWPDLLKLRICDRVGNLAKQDKAIITTKMKELDDRIRTLINSGKPIYQEDLAISGEDIKELGIPPGPIYREIFQQLQGICWSTPERNNQIWLLNYIKKNYL